VKRWVMREIIWLRLKVDRKEMISLGIAEKQFWDEIDAL
jgi:hypothetical protein